MAYKKLTVTDKKECSFNKLYALSCREVFTNVDTNSGFALFFPHALALSLEFYVSTVQQILAAAWQRC